ncbi:helix-turn-helix transcriptional regulator [Nocardia sp. NBC_00881]|uniref:helix-turn-helix domain-containing protein n=1 Tax=Nocardia sp. NBC_00881 TaxID=2975995 RepID=UPI00386E3401|nr:helix-turn-helix transcriptional regulator [Nocardia sp. NBC_00881]
MSGVEQARMALGIRLRELRKSAGFTGVEMARRAGWVPAKVSKIETGKQAPSQDDLVAWCDLTDSSLALPDLLATLTNLESMWSEWKRITAGGHARRQQRSVEIEAAARSIRNWEPSIIPGLLQIEDYARAILGQCIRFLGTTDDVEAAVAARMRRQRVLHRGRHRISILLGEQALHTTVGDDAAMVGQLEHLEAMIGSPRLSLGVVPQDADFIYTTTCFVLYDRRLAMVETTSAELSVTTPAELAYYEKAWAALHRQAAYGDQARTRIAAALNRRRSQL